LQLIFAERRFHCFAALSVCHDLAGANEELTNLARAESLPTMQAVLKMVKHLDCLGPEFEVMDVKLYNILSAAKLMLEPFCRKSLAVQAESRADDCAVDGSLSAADVSLQQTLVRDKCVQHEAEHLWLNFASVAGADGVADADCLGETYRKLIAAKVGSRQALPETDGRDSNFYKTLSTAMSSLEHFRRETHKECLAALSVCQDTAGVCGFFNFRQELKSAAKGGSWNRGEGGSLTLALEAVQKAIGEAVGGTAPRQH